MPPRGSENSEKIVSTSGVKYVTHRNQHAISCDKWLEGKRKDDELDGLWRIHDQLYDLQNFIKKHPGGPDWLQMTKGTDVTEAFEAHHLKGVAEQLLSRYFVKEATSPRNSPYTFEESGFYRTLKKRIINELPKVPKNVERQSDIFADLTVVLYLVLCLVSVYFESYFVGILAGYALTLTVNISHNYIHRKNNFRMYYLDLSMMSSREFRISHVLSHHLFPNTIHDLEISMYEPVVYFLPLKKSRIGKLFSWLFAFCWFPLLSIKGYFTTLFNEKKIRLNTLIPWVAVLVMYFVTGKELFECLKMFLWIIIWSSFTFHLIGKTAAHHHPDIFHDGDKARPLDEMDFGVHQLDAVSDRPNINGSPYLVLTNFGDHALHHLFPTLDHAILDHLYKIFLQTCIEFGVEWKLYTSSELVGGFVNQLARDKSNDTPPQPLKKK